MWLSERVEMAMSCGGRGGGDDGDTVFKRHYVWREKCTSRTPGYDITAYTLASGLVHHISALPTPPCTTSLRARAGSITISTSTQFTHFSPQLNRLSIVMGIAMVSVAVAV